MRTLSQIWVSSLFYYRTSDAANVWRQSVGKINCRIMWRQSIWLENCYIVNERVKTNTITTYWLEHHTLGAVWSPSYDTRSTHQPGREVVDDVPVQVGHDHDIELLRVWHHLHSTVVNDHRLKLYLRVQLRHLEKPLYSELLQTAKQKPHFD